MSIFTTYFINLLCYAWSIYCTKNITTAMDSVKYLVSCGVVGFLSEFIGINTGYPFGLYHYNTELNPLMLLGVPLNIPLIYGFLSLAVFGIVKTIIPQANIFVVCLVTGLIATIKDLATDPIRSTKNMIWLWDKGQSDYQYFRVPLLNFFGWVIVFMTATYAGYSATNWEGKTIDKNTQLRTLIFVTFLYINGLISIILQPKGNIKSAAILVYNLGLLPFLLLGWSSYLEIPKLLLGGCPCPTIPRFGDKF